MTRLKSRTGASAGQLFAGIMVFLLMQVARAQAEVFGELSDELDGVSLTYLYESGREYDVSFADGTLSYLRKDEPGR